MRTPLLAGGIARDWTTSHPGGRELPCRFGSGSLACRSDRGAWRRRCGGASGSPSRWRSAGSQARPRRWTAGASTAAIPAARATRRWLRSIAATSASCRSPGPTAPASSARASRPADKLAFEATPILVDGRLYLSTPTDQVIALDPASGRELWRYDPQIDRGRRYAEATSRGVSAWRDPEADSGGALRAPDLHRHARRPPDRARWRERAALRRVSARAAWSTSPATCGRPSPASMRSPRRPRSRATW